jgi:hypothetical protein
MATNEQRARRRAQRETAKRVKEGRATGKYKPVIPRGIRASVRASREQYGRDVIAGREPYPPKNSAEGRNLASLAGKARHGKADPIFEQKFKQYWYHKNDEKSEAPTSVDEAVMTKDYADNPDDYYPPDDDE